jgi:hypothetical protein
MAGDGHIRGVLFDSGDVLIRPIGGRWNPRYDFEDIVLAHHPETPVERFPAAFAAGQRVLDAGTTTANRTDYHRAMLAVLGIDAPSAALLEELEGTGCRAGRGALPGRPAGAGPATVVGGRDGGGVG